MTLNTDQNRRPVLPIVPTRWTVRALAVYLCAALSAPPDHSGQCLINIRGQSSLRYLKRSFTVKLVDAPWFTVCGVAGEIAPPAPALGVTV